MATNNLDAYDLSQAKFGGLTREDVLDEIFDLSKKIDTPFQALLSEDSVSNTRAEWVEETLSEPTLSSVAVDGADASGNDTVLGNRKGNYCQINRKVVAVSSRAQSSDNIGAADELRKQIINRTKELRRDMELALLSNQASTGGDSSNPSKLGGLGSWLETNTDRGTGGVDGGFDLNTGVTTTPTEGTGRALTTAAINDVVRSVYEQGGNPKYLMTVPSVVGKLASALIASNNYAQMQNAVSDSDPSMITAIGAVGVMMTQFGTLDIVPNRIMRDYATLGGTNASVDVFVLDPDYMDIGILRGLQAEPLAKQGLSERYQISVDYTLRVKNEKAQGVIADVDPTQNVT